MAEVFSPMMLRTTRILLADWPALAKITSVELIVNPHRRVLNVEPGANLLEQLRSHGVQMSHSCMAGRCGTCRCKVVAGDVLDGSPETQRLRGAGRRSCSPRPARSWSTPAEP